MSALNVTQLWSQAAAGGGGAGGSQLPNGTQAALTQEQQESVAKMSKVDKEQTLRLLCVDGWLTQVRARTTHRLPDCPYSYQKGRLLPLP